MSEGMVERSLARAENVYRLATVAPAPAPIPSPYRWGPIYRRWRGFWSATVEAFGRGNNACELKLGYESVHVFWTRIVAVAASLDAFDDGHEFILRGEGDNTLIIPAGSVPKLRRLLNSLARSWEVTRGSGGV